MFAVDGVLGGIGTVFPLPVVNSDLAMLAPAVVWGGTRTALPLPVVKSDSAMFAAPGVFAGIGTALPFAVVKSDSAMLAFAGIGMVCPLPVVKSECGAVVSPGIFSGTASTGAGMAAVVKSGSRTEANSDAAGAAGNGFAGANSDVPLWRSESVLWRRAVAGVIGERFA